MNRLSTIYKYPLPFENGDRQKISISHTYVILHVGVDPSGVPCLWAAVDEHDERKIDLEIVVVGTGHKLPHVGCFIGTILTGAYVWHIFTAAGNDAGNPVGSFAYLTKDSPREVNTDDA